YVFFSSRRRHTRFKCDWSSDVCSSDLLDRRKTVEACARIHLRNPQSRQERQRAAHAETAYGNLFLGSLLQVLNGSANVLLGRIEIGRASCRERGYIARVAVAF